MMCLKTVRETKNLVLHKMYMENLFQVKNARAAFTSPIGNCCLWIFAALVMLSSTVSATTTNTMINVGAWSNGANWSLGHEPTNSEDVIIPSDGVATVDVNAVCASLTIGDNSTSALVTITGTNSLTITTAGGGSGNLYINGANSNSLFQFNVNGGSVNVMGQVIPGGFNGGEINVTSGSVRFSNTSSLTWGEAINLNVTGTGSATFDGALDLTTVSAGTTTFSLTGNGSFVFNGLVTQSSSSCSISNSGTAGSIYFNAGYALSGGSFVTMAGEDIYFGSVFNNSGSALTLNATSNTYFAYATTITPTALITFGNVTINSGVDLNLNGDINVAKNWTNNNGNLIPGSSTVSFVGTSAQAINGTSASQTFNNISLSLTAGQTLSVSGSTTTLTVNNLSMTTGNFTAGAASTVNINGDLSIASGTYTPGANTNIGGNFSNSGTYTAASTKMLSFVGASSAVVSGSGTFTIYDLTFNKATKITVVDIQSDNFITGINSGNVYNFTFTRGTLKYNNSATLTDCHNQGSATSLTIPYDVIIEVNSGTMNLCKSGTMTGTASNVVLSGQLYVNGGTVRVLMSTTAKDFQYKVNGGTPQLFVASGSLYLGGGFNYNPTTSVDYVDFNMSGGYIYTGTASTALATFALNDISGGSTTMTGGRIVIEDRTSGATYPDVDLGGSNLTSYSVTDGTIQIGTAGTTSGSVFEFKAYPNTNYPHIVMNNGVTKTLRPLNNADFKMLSLTIGTSSTFNMSDATASVLTHKLTLTGASTGVAFSNSGTYTAQQGTVEFAGNVSQSITSSGTSLTLYNLLVNNSGSTLSGSGTLTTMTVQTLTVSSGTFSVGTLTTFTINGALTLNGGTWSAPATISVKGDWTNNGGTFTPNTSTVTFNGTTNQTINGTATAETFYNLSSNKTSGTFLNTTGSIVALTTNNFTNTTSDFTAPATMTTNGNFTLSSGTFTAGANLYIAGNSSISSSVTFTVGTGTVTYNGAGAQTIGGSKTTIAYYNLVVDKTLGSSLTKTGSVTAITTQDLTQIGGDFTAPATLTINGNAVLSGGTLVAGTTVNVYGDWTQSSSATFNPLTSTTNFRNATTTQVLQGTASTLTFYNIVVNKGTGILLSSSGSVNTITANNFTQTLGNFTSPTTLTLGGALTITVGTFTAGSTLSVTGALNLNGGTFNAGANTYVGGNWSHATGVTVIYTHNNGTVTFNGTAAQAITGSRTSETFYDLVINKTVGTTLSAGGSIATITANSITETQGNFTAPGTLTVSNDVAIQTGTFTTSTTATISGDLSMVNGTLVAGTTLNIQGDWVQGSGATFTPGLNTVNFTGGNTQSIQGTTPSITFYNLTVNKTAATAISHSGSVTTVATNNFTNTQGNYTAPATLNVNGTYTLTAGNFTAGTNMSVVGTCTLTAGTFTAGANLTLTGSWSHATAATFNHNNGIVTFIGGNAQTIGGTKTSETYYDVVVNKTSGTTLSRTGSIATITARNFTQTQGDFTATGATLTLSGNYTLSAGTFTPGTTFNLGGDWTHQSGATFTVGTGTTTFNGTGTQTIAGTFGSETFYNFTVNKTAGSLLTVDPSISSLTVNSLTQTQGNFTTADAFVINGNATFTAGTFTAGTTMNFKGNITKATAATFNAGTSTTTFDASVAQTINGTSSSITFNNVVLNKGLSTALAFGGSVATVTMNDLTHTLGTFTAPATVNINGSLSQSGGTYTAGTTLNLYGNFTRSGGTFTAGTGTVKLVGSTSAQSVGGTATTTFYGLQLNNTYSSAPQISAAQNINVSNTLTLTSGIVDLAANTITLGTAVANPGTLAGGSATAYLSKGTLNRWFNTTTIANGNIRGLFPVGDHTGNGYSPFYVTAPSVAPTTGGTVSSSYSDSPTNQSVAFLDAGTNIEIRTNAGWTVSTANGLAGGTYNLSANRSFCASCVGALANLRITLASGVVGTNGTTSGTVTSPVVNRTGLTAGNLTNTFYIGSTSFYSSPLPIELGDFKAEPKSGKVELTWFTFSESENDFFTVERSKDGVHFEKVVDVDGAGNSSTLKNYTTKDATPFNGISFYRLSQTDFNGDSKICKVVSVRINNTKSTITSVYPNPNDGSVIYADYFSDVTENVNVDLVDVLGRKVYSKQYSITGGETNSIMIQPNLNMMAGKYLVVVSGEAGKFCTQIMVK